MKTDGGGWTVFQRRVDGSVSFLKNWASYKTGFGDLHGNHWLGLDILHKLTKSASTLRVDLKNWDSTRGYAKYNDFKIDDESQQYKLHISGYIGDAGDSMQSGYDLNGMYFSTPDKDNDYDGSNCAIHCGGPWWHYNCAYSSLNALFPDYSSEGSHRFMSWYTWKSNWGDIKYCKIKVRSNN